MYNDIKLEKGLYNLTGKSFTAALEELDPSSAYCGTSLEKLDAFERQLKRFNIRVSGQDCDCVDKFFSSTETAVLFPEFVTRCIRKGFDETVLSSICAAKTICSSSHYLGCVLEDGSEYGASTQGNTFPASTVNEGTTATVLKKYGRVIKASYEAVRRQRLDVFGVMLRSIGVKLAAAVTKEAAAELAEDSDTLPAESLTYDALAEFYGLFDSFELTTIIASPDMAAKIAAMEQLSDCRSDEEGRLVLPFGASLIKSGSVPENTIIGIDRNYALEFITSTDLIIETDKLIDRQLDEMTVSITCGFRKIAADAVKLLLLLPGQVEEEETPGT